MTSLSEENALKLKSIISVYRKYRDDFVYAEPILNCPDGFSITGFRIQGKSHNYVILLKELTDRCDTGINLKEILATSDENATLDGKLTKEKSYVFGII